MNTIRGALILVCLGMSLLVPMMARADAYADAVTQMSAQLGENFHVRRWEMFICAGDMGQREFDAIVDGTVAAAAKALWTQYFVKRPNYPIRVYLFSDSRTYRAYAKQLFGDTDVSAFGYYKPDVKALVMNIGTGTGTLVHEMTHALMAPDFPGAPTWFSEGLASLYEQCTIGKDGLTGLVNWRLPVLRAGQREKVTLPLAMLIATSRDEFLDRNSGVHYAQARYFCLYLQERGLLQKLYVAYRDGVAKDPTGAKTIAKVCHQSVPQVEKAWLTWVNTLEET